MSQAISILSANDKVYVPENGVDVVYEIAAFNHHAENSVTLVRYDVYGDEIQWHYQYGTNYAGSTLDTYMQEYASKYDVQYRQELISVPITHARYTSGSETINRKVFSLSRTEIGCGTNGGISEGTNLGIYDGSAYRIKTSAATHYWLRSVEVGDDDRALCIVSSTGKFAEDDEGLYPTEGEYKTNGYGVVPAHVISSSINVSDDPDTNGVYSIEYPDAVPDKPTLVYPSGGYVPVDEEIVFSWQHVIDTGTDQTQADLQSNIDGGDWTDLTTVVGSDQTYTAPADTFSAGNLQWRTRTYNSESVAGDWSDAVSFVGIGATESPTITSVTESSRPTISWQSVGQYGYQVQVISGSASIWDSGEVSGTDKSVQVPLFLENGSYTIKVRIIGQLLTWSEWSIYNLTLAITPPTAPTISVSNVTYGARITIDEYDAAITGAYLLRDGFLVADITGSLYCDDLAPLGTVSYIVRVVDADDNYADSNTVSTIVSVDGVILAPVDDLSSTVKMSMTAADQPAVTRSKVITGSSQHYAGRQYPVHTFSEFVDEEYSPAYYYTSFSDFADLNDLINRRRTVLYRDVLGNRFYGVITGINDTQDTNMVIFSLRLARVDYVEEIKL